MKRFIQKFKETSVLTLIVLSIFIIPSEANAQEFNVRLNVTACNTFTLQIQCVDGAYLPTAGDDIISMDISFASLNSFGLTAGTSSNGFNIASPATATDAGYNIVTFAENGFGQLQTSFTINTWYDVCNFTISSGSTNIFLTTTATTPNFSNKFVSIAYLLNNESGTVTNQGTLAKTWLGTTNSTWATGTNWCPASAPATGETLVLINQTNDPVLASDVTLGGLEIQAGGTLTLSGNQLTVNGALSGTGTIVGSATSKLGFGGTGASTLLMDQTTPGTTNLLQNLTLNNASGLTLGNTVRLLGIITHTAGTLTTGGNLTLGATGTGTYAQIAGTGNGTISGNVTMEKFLTNTNAGWRHFSLPLAGTLSGFSGIDLSYSSPENVMFWDATDNSGSATGWATGAAGSSRSLGGFTIFSNNGAGGAFDVTQTISFTGTYDKSDLGFNIKATVDPNGAGGTATGWNLIGNPFPSNLDLATMFTDWNIGNIPYRAIHIYDATTGQYKAILSGVGITNYNTAGGQDNTTGVLAPFQAFWVKATTDQTFTVKNSYRTTSTTGLGTFMKKNLDLARFDVLDPNGKWDQAVVYFHEDATSGFDGSLDGYKMISFNADVPSLYAVNMDGTFSITAESSDEFEHVIPMGFRSAAKGEMTLSLNNAELDNKWFVYVEDKDLGIFYDIKTKPYTFDHVQNSDERFVVHFQQHPLSAEKLVDDVKSMKVSGNGEEVYVFVPNYFRDQTYEIAVYDLQGRLVYENSNTHLDKGMNTLNIKLENSAIYVVRVKASEGMVSGKVQIF